jgi:O-antigen/teichoic acid export membrane protein
MMMRALRQSKFFRDTLTLQAGKLLTVGLGVLSTVVVTRLLEPAAYGVYGLADSLFALFHLLDITGIGVATSTRLALAIGARDTTEIHGLFANYLAVAALASAAIVTAMLLLALPAAALLHGANGAEIGVLALLLACTTPLEYLYNLVIASLAASRSIRALALLQNAAQLVLTVLMIGAAVLAATPQALVGARVAYSVLAACLALPVYLWLRRRLHADGIELPGVWAAVRAAPRARIRHYAGFGVLNALDRNAALLLTQVPQQLVGAFGGVAAAGFLALALRGMAQASVAVSAVWETLQGAVPQAIGRGEFARLYQQMRRIVAALALGGLAYYGAVAVGAALLLVPVFGARWQPALPAVLVLCLYGVITTVGGSFAPIYRGLNLMGKALRAKAAAIVVGGLVGLGALLALHDSGTPQAYAAAGGLAVVAAYATSVSMTGWFALRALRERAADAKRSAQADAAPSA